MDTTRSPLAIACAIMEPRLKIALTVWRQVYHRARGRVLSHHFLLVNVNQVRAKIFHGLWVRLFALDCMRYLYKNNISTDLELCWKYYFCELAKSIWRIINTIVSIWQQNILIYLSLYIIFSSKLTVIYSLFLEPRSRKSVCLSEQIIAADKYLILQSIKYFRSHTIGLNASRGWIFPS